MTLAMIEKFHKLNHRDQQVIRESFDSFFRSDGGKMLEMLILEALENETPRGVVTDTNLMSVNYRQGRFDLLRDMRGPWLGFKDDLAGRNDNAAG